MCAARRGRWCAPARASEPQQLDAIVAHFGVDRDFRHQRHAIAVGDHLHYRCQRRGAEAGGTRGLTHRFWRGAEGQRLVAQAVALLQQNEPALIDVVDRHRTARRQRLAGRHRQQKRVRRTASGSRHRRRPPATPASRSRATRQTVPRAASWSASRALQAAIAENPSAAAAARAAAHRAPASG